jgi:hypothetical protein
MFHLLLRILSLLRPSPNLATAVSLTFQQLPNRAMNCQGYFLELPNLAIRTLFSQLPNLTIIGLFTNHKLPNLAVCLLT